jgi:hypothetical protein
MTLALDPLPAAEVIWKRVNKRNKCPICEHPDNCAVADDGTQAYCRRHDRYSAPAGWKFVKFGRDDGALFVMEDATIIRREEAAFWERRKKQEEAGPQKAELASEENRASVINWLLAKLGLAAADRVFLVKEGFEISRAEALGYRTLPVDGRKEILKEMVARFGQPLCRALGFVHERIAKGGSSYLDFSAISRNQPVLLFPVRNVAGLPVALKARWEETDQETGETKRQYRLMSAGETSLGASVGTPIHVARPAEPLSEWRKRVIITEGERKADYAADILGVTVLGIQGVSTWRSGHLLETLFQLGATEIIEAYDADKSEKLEVARQASEMCNQLAGAGYRVVVANWPIEQGKGLDDFLRSADEAWKLSFFTPKSKQQISPDPAIDTEFEDRYGLSRWKSERISRENVLLDKETLEWSLNGSGVKEKKVHTLKEAREAISLLFMAAFAQHLVENSSPRRIVLKATTGSGKSHSIMQQILFHLQLSRPGRILYLTDTKQAYQPLIEAGGPLHQYMLDGLVAVREGRDPKPASPFHCKRVAECHQAGQARHPAAADVCGSCPFGSEANWKKYAAKHGYNPDQLMLWNCKKFGYLGSLQACKNAQVVIAPKAAMLTASEELGEFDFIIIDEETQEHLLEKQELGAEQIRQWEESRRRLETMAMNGLPATTDPDSEGQEEEKDDDEEVQNFAELVARHTPFDKFDSLIKAALIDFDQVQGKIRKPARARLLPVLQARAEAAGVDLAQAVDDCYQIYPGKRFKRYQWEKPYRANGQFVTPLRLIRDLIEQLDTELRYENPNEADTQLWIDRRPNPDTAQMETVLTIYLPRKNVLKYLNGTAHKWKNQLGKAPTVFVLDATAGPEIKLALPYVEEIEIRVDQPLYVIQLSDHLYTAQSVAKPETMGRINRAIEYVAQRHQCKDAVIFSKKEFNPDYAKDGDKSAKLGVQLSVNGRVRYGHFERHNKGLNDFAGCDLIAITGHYSDPLDEIEARVMAFRRRDRGFSQQEANGKFLLKRYGWQCEMTGQGLARWCKSQSDPDIQAAIEHSTRSTVMQTIGRGRASEHRSLEKPLVVVLFDAMPVEGLPVNQLTTMEDLLDEAKITEAQQKALADSNAARHKEALAKIDQAKHQLAAEGKTWVTATLLAKRAGVSKATLHYLGYRTKHRGDLINVNFDPDKTGVKARKIPSQIHADVYKVLITRPHESQLENSGKNYRGKSTPAQRRE